MKMYQCLLVRQNEDGTTTNTVGWIEERAAKIKAEVELIGASGDSKFFTVEGVWMPPFESTELKELQKNNRNSLPSIRDK